jgi:V8-like Glu-specific endopeptidase
MGITFSNRIVALTASAAIAAAYALLPGAATAAPAATAAAPAVARVTRVTAGSRQAAATRGAWLTGNTTGRGLRWGHHGVVAAAVGKIFFTLGGTDYVCSGALVRSKHFYVVITAAHCVSGGHGQWATNWTFVPGYADGTEPYGEYTARRFFVSPRWTGTGGGTEQYDIAFVRVTRATLYGRRSQVAKPPGGLPLRFAASQRAVPAARAYVFGYPALPPYSGLYLNYCAGHVKGSATHHGSAETVCAMTAGDSGGPWLTGFSPRAGTGTITAVTTYKLSGDPRDIYGTVLGPVARALYQQATA